MNDKIKTFVPWEEIEVEAQKQIINVSNLPFIFKWVAVMPDCHYGKGATVGTVIATKGAVVPAAVGVDIGCGMISVETSLELGDLKNLKSIREGIERRIPMSAGKFNEKIGESSQKKIDELRTIEKNTGADYDKFTPHWPYSLGTLGGGNHFIEVCTDERGAVWLTLHSGSRGVGNKIGMHHISVAQKICGGIELPDKDLAYLTEGTDEFNEYIRDLAWAQNFAKLNRDEMMDRVLIEMSYQLYGKDGHQKDIEVRRINCHHNFTQIENHFGEDVWVTRKGAIQAKTGMEGMIPGSMATNSYIVSGLENPNSFHSAPHGAGRRMSRNKAKAAFTMSDMENAMAGIEFRKSEAFIDEIPSAYKDIDRVMEYSKELVVVKHKLKQIVNCKGD